MLQVVVLESILWQGPLGLRFLDLARGVPVSDSLQVSAWPLGTTGPHQAAVRSPISGVYGFRGLPGLRRFETGDWPATAWCGSPPESPPGSPPTPDDLLDLGTLRGLVEADEGRAAPNFVVLVEDAGGRFLPQVLLLCLPKTALLEVPLFSAPTRRAPGGLGTVRGELWDQAAGAPASWALVTVSPDGATTYATVADARGMFAVFVPYASALPAPEGSPPHGGGDFGGLTWPLTIGVFSAPTTLRRVPGVDPPDTRSILEQGAAAVYDWPGVHGPRLVRPIRFGDDLVVATQGLSRLLIDPAGPLSPP